jgi:hypothetical protein
LGNVFGGKNRHIDQAFDSNIDLLPGKPAQVLLKR